MYPPVDPWGEPEDPIGDGFFPTGPAGSTPPQSPPPFAPPPSGAPPGARPPYPTPSHATPRHAAEEPDPPRYGRASVPVPPPLREPTAEMPTVTPRSRVGRGQIPGAPVSWQRTSRASMRSLADGWGFTATGLLAVFCGWGVWAAAGRGTIGTPLFGLALVVFVAAGVFVISRLLGFFVLERMMGRTRLHARWAHFLTGLFLTAAAVSYLAKTSWIVSGLDWISEQWQRVG